MSRGGGRWSLLYRLIYFGIYCFIELNTIFEKKKVSFQGWSWKTVKKRGDAQRGKTIKLNWKTTSKDWRLVWHFKLFWIS